ncbi:MAG: hypothetical protein PHR35_07610 [Kiritimatiellae bacterium]|nr:hypothetical protein [Kiritimatiellia bacterium]
MSNTERQSKTSREPTKGCIIEADSLALGSIGRVHEICERHLAKSGIKLDPGLFGRFLLGAYLENGMNRLMQFVGRGSAAEISHAVREEYLTALAGATVAADAPIVKLVAKLSASQVRVGLLTRLDADKAATALAPLLGGEHTELLPEAQHALVGGFSWDVWRRSAEKLQMQENLCMALVASAASGKAALAAGLQVVAVSDPMTAHQDFGGASFVFDGWSAEVLPAVMQTLRLE